MAVNCEVEALPYRFDSPTTFKAPLIFNDANVPAPALIASLPILIVPKLAVMEPPSKIPTVVRDEVKMPVPRVLVVKTSVPSIWYLV